MLIRCLSWIALGIAAVLFPVGTYVAVDAGLRAALAKVADYSALNKKARLANPIDPNGPLGGTLKEAREAERARDYQRAVALYTRALEADPHPGPVKRELLRLRAFANEDLKDYTRAEADFTAALLIEPVDPEFYAKRGFFLTRRQRYDDALADFQKGAALAPSDGGFAYGEAGVHAARGDHRRAIERYNEAIRIDPKVTNYYAARGSAHNHAGLYQEAYADYDKALRMGYPRPFPRETARSHMGRGYASLQLKQYRRAIDDFDVALETVPRASNALAWRGSAYQGLGDRDKAIADYRAALAIDPRHRRAAENLEALETP